MNRISVIVPMLNEAAYIERFVADVAGQDFPGEIEVIVADGGSTDSSVERLRAAAGRCGLGLTIVSNPARWVSHGLNACVAHATGELLVRLDCHSRYPRDYVRRCAAVAEETDAMAVGGIVVPDGRTITERAVASAMDSPFGGIGWMRDTHGPTRRDSDILTYGAFRPEVFGRVGLFDESLQRNQDDDFTLRIRRAGGRVVLDSSIRVHYTPRGSYRKVFGQYLEYGFWKVAVMRKHRRPLSARSVAPPAFVTSLALLGPTASVVSVARWILAGELVAYASGAVAFAALSVRRRGEPWPMVPRVAAAFPTFHIAYGLGVLRGALAAARGRLRRGSASRSRQLLPDR